MYFLSWKEGYPLGCPYAWTLTISILIQHIYIRRVSTHWQFNFLQTDIADLLLFEDNIAEYARGMDFRLMEGNKYWKLSDYSPRQVGLDDDDHDIPISGTGRKFLKSESAQVVRVCVGGGWGWGEEVVMRFLAPQHRTDFYPQHIPISTALESVEIAAEDVITSTKRLHHQPAGVDCSSLKSFYHKHAKQGVDILPLPSLPSTQFMPLPLQECFMLAMFSAVVAI